jgi:hypothetical protein
MFEILGDLEGVVCLIDDATVEHKRSTTSVCSKFCAGYKRKA